MPIKTFLLVLGACLAPLHAQAINKCIDSTGKVSFTDQPCSGRGEVLTVKPASGNAPQAPETGKAEKPGGVSPTASGGRLQLDKLQDERQRREKWHLMRDAQNALDQQIAACDAEQNAIAGQTRNSNSNLAGATRNVAITNQMHSVLLN